MTDSRLPAILVPSVPVFYYIELTPACNSACPGCGNVFAHQGVGLGLQRWEEILDKIGPSASRLRLTGGEPTLHPDFEGIMNAIARRGIPFAIFTNGRWQNPPQLLKLLKSTECCVSMLVSLHGADSQTHDAFTATSGSFAEACSGIEAATNTLGIPVNISTVITALNYNRTQDVVRLALDLGARHVVFNRYIGKDCGPISVSEQQLRKAVEDIQELSRDGLPVRFGTCIPQCFYPSSSAGCLAGITYCTVDPWGAVRPCNHAPLACGNLLEQPIEEIWHSPTMQYWRDLIPTQCLSCVELATCHGGCKAIAMQLGVEKDPLIREAITSLPIRPPKQIVLSEMACPISRFTMRREAFGYLLVHGSQAIPVAELAEPMLASLNGQTTLREIQRVYGDEALSFVGTLYRQGFVELQ